MDRTVNHQRLLKECLVYLSSVGYFVWGNNTGAIKNGDRYQRYGLPGSSDIIGISPNGYFIAIEIKTGKAVQNKQQKKFEERVMKNNGTYKVVRSLKDLKELINENSNTRNGKGASGTTIRSNKDSVRDANGAEVSNVERVINEAYECMGAVGDEG